MWIGGASEMRQARLRTHEGAAGVHLVHQIEPLHRGIARVRQADRRRVVDQDIDAAECVDCARHGTLDVGLVPDVDGDWQRASARPFNLFRGRVNRAGQLGMWRLGFRRDDNPRAIARRPERNRLPDAAAGACNEERLSCECSHDDSKSTARSTRRSRRDFAHDTYGGRRIFMYVGRIFRCGPVKRHRWAGSTDPAYEPSCYAQRMDARDTEPEIGTSRRRAITAGLLLGMSLGALEATVVSTAMPTVNATLGGLAHYSWVLSAYLLTSTAAVPIWGRLSDLYGRRRMYLTGIAVFLVGSALSGAAQSMEQLIVFRALQGLGAGAIIPLSMTIVGELYALEERARAQALFSGVWGIASIAGPIVGGYVTDALSWRWVFYLNLPFGIFAVIVFALAYPL